MFRRLDSVSVFRWNLVSWAQWIELVPFSGQEHQHKIEYKPNTEETIARFKTNITKTPPRGVALMSMQYFAAIVVKIRVLSE
jgi:hypothetical protein